MRAVPVGGQLTAHPPKQRTRTAGSVPLLKEMPHISNISNVSNRYSGCEVLLLFLIFLILFSGNRQIPGLATGAVGHSLFYSRR